MGRLRSARPRADVASAVRVTAVGIGAAVVIAALAGCSTEPRIRASTPTPTASMTPTSKPIDRIVLPANPRVYFYGDSWTHGASADAGRGFPEVVGEALGWNVELGPDQSGAGYVHTYVATHPVFPEQVQTLDPVDADLIVLGGGLNDVPGPLDDFWGSVTRTVETLREKGGGAPIVIVGPASPDGVTPEGLSAIDFEEAAVARGLGIPYISPIKEGWFNPTNVKALMNPRSIHPNTAGHAYYGGRLAADLLELTTATP